LLLLTAENEKLSLIKLKDTVNHL